MKLYPLLACLLFFALNASAQSPTCPRVWRGGDTLWTDPAPHIQWLREGQPVPGANDRWLLPPANERASYSVAARGGLSSAFEFSAEGWQIAGYVFDELHRPVAGATVRRGGFAATTDEKGRFALNVNMAKPPSETPVVVTVEKEGYWRNASRQYLHRQATTETRLMLHTQRVTNRVDAATGGELLYRGFSLRLPPNGVQTESGLPYNGTILLSVEGATPSDPDFGLRMPGGDFAAIDAGGNDVMLYSYGYLSAEMRTESGQKLELRPEARATLRFYLPYTDAHRPDSVPLWHFNEETAVWEQEGWSVRNGSVYEGQVSHFSSWNCDIPGPPPATVRGRLVDCVGEPVSGGWVNVGQRATVCDSFGGYWSFIPGGIAFDVWTASDTLRNITIPSIEERTLEDLKAFDFGGLAVYNQRTQMLNVHLWGFKADSVRVSIDGGLSWTNQREFAKIVDLPSEVRLEGGCMEQLRVFTLPRSEDCRKLTESELASAQRYLGWQDALATEDVVYRIALNQLDARWDLLIGFPCLQELDLQNDSLTFLPELIGNLTHLQALYLNENGLRNLPESLPALYHLQTLNLGSNQFSQMPGSLVFLPNLQTLFMYDNRLVSLPENIDKLTTLQMLVLNDNRLTVLPESIGNLSSLQTLVLNNNRLTDLPASLANLADTLEKLYLGGNLILPTRRAAIQAMLPNTQIFWE